MTYLGITASKNLSQRVTELRLILILIDKINTSLLYKQTYTKDLIDELSENEQFGKLYFLENCKNSLQENADISIAWKESLKLASNCLHLEKEDMNLLKSIGNIIGAYDAKSQVDELNLVSDFIRKNLESATNKYQTQGKLYRTLGILSGIATAIVLI